MECPFLDLNFDQDFENGNVAGNRPTEEVNNETETPLRTSTRVKRPVERYGEWVYNTNSIVTKAEPTSLSEALGRKVMLYWNTVRHRKCWLMFSQKLCQKTSLLNLDH